MFLQMSYVSETIPSSCLACPGTNTQVVYHEIRDTKHHSHSDLLKIIFYIPYVSNGLHTECNNKPRANFVSDN